MTIPPADIRLHVPSGEEAPPGWAADAVDVLERRDVLLQPVSSGLLKEPSPQPDKPQRRQTQSDAIRALAGATL